MLNIELRKITYSKALSEETNAYTAQVWIDGAHVCDVSNRGHGGCDEQHPAKGKTNADIQALEAAIKAERPPETVNLGAGRTFEMSMTLETVCSQLLVTHLLGADLRRLLKRTVVYFDPESKAVLSYKGKHEGVARAHLITETVRKHPSAKILNNLPFAEALVLFKAAA